jgi:hypothetical protein
VIANMETKMKNSPIVTDLDDARQLRRAGLPIDLPLTHREFSREYSVHWFDLMSAHVRFMIAVRKFSDGPRTGTPSQWKLVKRGLKGLSRAMQSCDAFVGKLSGNVNPPVFKSEQDGRECRILSEFLVDRAMPFAEYWQSAIDAADDATPLTIRPADIPKWIDEET